MLRRTLGKRLLLFGRDDGVTWLLNDGFDTDAAAPLASPRTCEPGPGTLVKATDSTNVASISGGRIIFNGANATNDPMYSWGSFARVSGRALLMGYRRDTVIDVQRVGWGSSGSGRPVIYSFRALDTDTMQVIGGGVTIVPISVAAVDLDTLVPLAFVLGDDGCKLFVYGTSGWQLAWIWTSGTTNSLFVGAGAQTSGAQVVHLDYVRVRDLPAPFDTDDGLCVVDVDTPVSGTAYTSVADAISDLAVTAENPLDGDANTRCGLYYRTDADQTPAWHVYVDGQGRFRLDGIAADGSRTNYINVAGVIAGGATVTLRSIYDVTLQNVYSLAGVTWTKRGGEIDVSLNDDVARIIPEAPAGWTLGALKSWARRSAAYDELDRL